MTSSWGPVVLAVPATYAALCAVVRPAGDVPAPRRLTAVRAAVVLGAYAVAVVEVSSAFRALTAPVVAGAWCAALLVAGALAARRHRRDRSPDPAGAGRRPAGAPRAWAGAPRAWAGDLRAWAGDLRDRAGDLYDRAGEQWCDLGRAERFLLGATAALIAAELLVALLARPNNYDSQTYHLPRIEHWVRQRSVAFYPTAIHRQLDLPPGAEFLLTHLRLLTGGNRLYGLPQWAAGIGCVLAASRIAAQLGGGRRAQLVTAFLVATTPMVVLEASGTQTDLAAAAWTTAAATLALDGLRRRTGPGGAVLLGAATGLTALTKTPGLFLVVPLLLAWGIAQFRRAPAGTAARGLLILLVAAAVAGPFAVRVDETFGNPLGPPELRDSIPMQRHDPGHVLVNGLKILATAFDTPLPPVRAAATSAVDAVAHAVGVDPADRSTNFGTTSFPVAAWYPDEDRVSFPLVATLTLIAVILALTRPHRIAPGTEGPLRVYAAALVIAALTYAATVKWQPWGNRLLLFLLIAATPVAGRWIEQLRPRRPAARWPTAAVLGICALSAVLAVSYGFPRRLVGSGSVFTVSGYTSQFLRRPQWRAEYEWASARVAASGARRVGLVEGNDDWEYPWWLMLPGRDLVALRSVVPHHPAATVDTVDAIVCTGARAACVAVVPRGWTLEFRTYVGYALPPR